MRHAGGKPPSRPRRPGRAAPTATRRRPAPRPRPVPAAPPRPPAGVRLMDVEEVELAIEKLVAGGDGLARFAGVPIFVPRTAPGDRVRARIVERRPDYGRAEMLELLSAGPGRRTPPCPHFADCGGCDLQHLDDAVQLRLKAEATVETLRRISGLTLPPPRTILAGSPWGYRLRTRVHVRPAGSGFEVGYHARGSHRLVPVASCPILLPELEREVTTLARRLTAPAPSRVELAAGDDGEVGASPAAGGIPAAELSRRVGEFEYLFDARCFFQGHADLLESFVATVVGEEKGGSALDLYGGVGLFALPLARRYGTVTLVEGDRIAARFARKNTRRARLPGIEVVGQAVESWIVRGLADDVDRVVVDPPRDGLALVVRGLLAARPPRRLTYVSCHAAALGRDLKHLASNFDVESLALVDLFPQTGQMETIAQLVRRG